MQEIISDFNEGKITKEQFVEEINKNISEQKESILTYKDIAAVEEAFKVIFKKSVHILTKVVRTGGTSANVYVPKDFKGCPVTIIIWDKRKFKDGTK